MTQKISIVQFFSKLIICLIFRIKKQYLIFLKVREWSTYDHFQLLASEAPCSSVSKNQKKSFIPGHFQEKLSITIDVPKFLEITEVILVCIALFYSVSCTTGKLSCTYVLRDWMPVCIELTLDLHFKRGCFISRCTYLEYSQQQEKKVCNNFQIDMKIEKHYGKNVRFHKVTQIQNRFTPQILW